MEKIDKAFVKVVHKSAHEAIDFFFDDPEKIKGMLKLEKPLCPASYALYFILTEKEDFSTMSAQYGLKATGFCRKAIKLFPRMFDMRAPLLVPRLKEIMASARARIDVQGKIIARPNPNSSNKDYVSHDRNSLIRELEDKYRDLSDEQLVAKIRKKYSESSRGKTLQAEIDACDDELLSSPYHNKFKEMNFELAKLIDDEKFEIIKARENRFALDELKTMLDFTVWTYKGFVLSPSVVSDKGSNPKLFSSSQEAVRYEFEEKRKYVEHNRHDLCDDREGC